MVKIQADPFIAKSISLHNGTGSLTICCAFAPTPPSS
jgi:hypothetical protein